ncbi:hypothetical protein [Roseiconus lacunae]|uniref:Uncharacterized protein n=1 Tax=Roseiconus lacunae TaxID=2605694 RepID=A0ABT7PH40_9BACT|nr:hypothetical protein [Roseiconus lacunae]MDM4015823.1 hypothetical protein [Roseiconus lacunae]
MSDNRPAQNVPAQHITFNNEQSGDNAKNVQGMKIVEGDEVSGDKIGNQVAGDNHGSMSQISATDADIDYTVRCREAVADCVDALDNVFQPLPADDGSIGGDAGDNLVSYQPPDCLSSSDQPGSNDSQIPIDPIYHPQTLLADAVDLSQRTPTADQASDFGDRWSEMLRRGGAAASAALETVGPVAISVIEALASPPFPWNLIATGIRAAIKESR